MLRCVRNDHQCRETGLGLVHAIPSARSSLLPKASQFGRPKLHVGTEPDTEGEKAMTHPDSEREACMTLEPCPLCGSVAAMVTYGSGNSHTSCRDPNQLCMIDGPVRSSPEAAAEAWNTRAHADARDAARLSQTNQLRMDAACYRFLCENPSWKFIECLCRDFPADSPTEFKARLTAAITKRWSADKFQQLVKDHTSTPSDKAE
jgi:hypothetical protein